MVPTLSVTAALHLLRDGERGQAAEDTRGNTSAAARHGGIAMARGSVRRFTWSRGRCQSDHYIGYSLSQR